MKKIPSLFVRNYEMIGTVDGVKNRVLATEQVTPGCEWVLNGEGIATRKWDGTAVLITNGVLYKRYDAKHGKTPPPNFEPCQEPDPVTGHWPGWVPVYEHLPENKWIIEAFSNSCEVRKPHGLPDGTYEAIGPKIGGNKDKSTIHQLRKHGAAKIWTSETLLRTFKSIRDSLEYYNIEGIVFHHPDGRMCKVKRSDFGLPW